MTLSSQQIQQLFAFTYKKYVRWYDLQVELVDHLANKIEEEMENNNALHFEEALGKVYAQFGIFGFANIVKEKESEIRKAKNRAIWVEIKQQFNWPSIIKSIAVLAIIYTITTFLSSVVITSLLMLYYFLDLIIYKKIKTIFNQNKQSRKLLLTQDLPNINFAATLYFQVIINYNVHVYFVEGNIENAGNKPWLCALLFAGYLINVASTKVTKTMTNKAKKLYPEVFA